MMIRQAESHHVVVDTAFLRQETLSFQMDRRSDFGKNNTPNWMFDSIQLLPCFFIDPVICSLHKQLISRIVHVGDLEEWIVARLESLMNERKSTPATEHSEIRKPSKRPVLRNHSSLGLLVAGGNLCP